MVNPKTRTKIAQVPPNVWEDRKRFARLLGYNSAAKGFLMNDKILNGEFTIKKKSKSKKDAWILELL